MAPSPASVVRIPSLPRRSAMDQRMSFSSSTIRTREGMTQFVRRRPVTSTVIGACTMMSVAMEAPPFPSMSAEEIVRRKAYLEITPEDERLLREAHPHLQSPSGQIIDRFYEYLLAHEHTRLMISALTPR